MFVIILLVVLLSMAAFGVIAAFWVLKRPKGSNDSYYASHLTIPQAMVGIAVPTLCVILALVTSGLWIGLNAGTRGEVASLEAFYYETIGTYEFTISRTGDVEISAAQPGIIDVTYFGQAEVVGLRIVELRDEVAHFNRRLRWYRTFGDDPIASAFIANVPDDMHPITITDLDALQKRQ